MTAARTCGHPRPDSLCSVVTSMAQGSKKCTRCLEVKPYGAFGARKGPPGSLVSSCRACRCAISKDYVSRNSEAVKAVQKKYYAENMDSERAKARAGYYANLEDNRERSRGFYHANKQASQASHKAWAAKNYHVVLAHNAKRRATLIGRTPSWANAFFISEIYDLAKKRDAVTGVKWHVDHIVPLVSKLVCGLHVEHNLQVIPAEENLSKHNRFWPDMPSEKVGVL